MKVILILASMFLFPFCRSLPKFIPTEKHLTGNITSDDLERNFKYYLPNSKSIGPFPLVLVLHGGGGSSEGMIYLTRMSEIAESEGFIVVYPNGYENRWNDGRGIKHSATDQKNVDDTSFIRNLIKSFQKKYDVDENRIHVVGLSNGGFMAQRLICEAPDVFASGFSIAATTSKFLANKCNHSNSTSVSFGFIFGKKDDIIPFDGGTILIPTNPNNLNEKIPAGESISFIDSLSLWKNRLQCENEKQEYIESMKKKYPKDILKFSFSNCKEGNILDAYLIESGGHIWPHGFFYIDNKKYGYLSNDLNATTTVVEFFKNTPKLGKEKK